jgi:hypothetical protein
MQQISQEEDLSQIIEKLQLLAAHVLQKPFSRCLITGEEKLFPKSEVSLKGLLSSLPAQRNNVTNIGVRTG